jgi:myosin heavy subunit
MQNQSIIISGESGSGKTETSKIILDFLTTRAVYDSAMSVTSSDDDAVSEPEVATTTAEELELDTEVSDTLSMLPSPPRSESLALSYPQSNTKKKLSPVAVGERLMETIPILESFGNAKTHRNHNSSRFGKYMRLQFSTDAHELSGASIDTYLLEKSRLVFQPQGERNFHVFYELLHSPDAEHLARAFHLEPKKPELYSYLNQSGCMSSEFINDAENFGNLCRALDFIGIHGSAQDDIFKIVAGLLHMGNIEIGEEDTSEGKTACIANEQAEQALLHASELLNVAPEELKECILLKRIMTRGSRRNSIYFAKRDVRNAVYSRDTIAKTIYENVFTWLMRECASALDYDSGRSDVIPYIGVLDIFGFEDFEPKNRNSFEQLLINYANEALQSLFNACIFEAEQELYRSEHIFRPINHSLSFPFTGLSDEVVDGSISSAGSDDGNDSVQYADNRECLNLISSRHGGLFVTIDNVARLPQPSDRKLNEKLHTLFKRHPCFPTPHPKDMRDTFKIRHYAGTVTYTINSFVDKNNNIISEQFEELLQHSRSRVMQDMAGSNAQANGAAGDASTDSLRRVRSSSSMSVKSAGMHPGSRSLGGAAKRLKGGSTSSLFATQMKGLTTELEGTSCNFVRCIKPNTQMKVGMFDKQFVVEQLRCSGTVQACEVLRVGLPTRILYAEVVDAYRNLLPANVFARFDGNDKLFTQAILYANEFPTDAYRLGDTRLFFRTGKIDLLDKLLAPASSNSGKQNDELAGKMMRYLHKKRWVSVATRAVVFSAFQRIFEECKFRRRAIIIQCMVRQHLARKRVRKERVLHRISRLWNKMSHRAQIMHAYQDRPDDKMALLNKLLARNYLPPDQRWLLKWLGPLQRVIYLQKRWKKIIAQYQAKRAFLWLHESVKKKRAVLRMQAHVRCLIAKTRFQRLKRERLARERWRAAILKVKVFRVFARRLREIHVSRLEKENQTLQSSLNEAAERMRLAEEESRSTRLKLKQIEVSYDSARIEAKQQEERIRHLEMELQRVKRRGSITVNVTTTDSTSCSGSTTSRPAARVIMAGSLLERVIRFFTCSATISPPPTPGTQQQQQAHAMAMAANANPSTNPTAYPLTPKYPVIVKAFSEKDLKRGRLASETLVGEEMPEDEEIRAQDSDRLWSISRYMF